MKSQMKSQRKRRRRRPKIIGAILQLLIPVLFLCALGVSAVVFFKLEAITVEGQSRYTEEQIISASKLELGKHLLLIDQDTVADNVASVHPYIQSVEVSLRLPAILAITVEEEKAIFEVYYEGEGWLMGQNGKLLEKTLIKPDLDPPMITPLSITSEPMEDTIIRMTGLTLIDPAEGTQITVVPEEQGGFAGMKEVLETLSNHQKMEEITYIHLCEDGSIEFDYQMGRFVVKISTENDVDYKIRALFGAIEQLESYESGIVDLTRQDCAALFIPS
ncbi:MAG: FtsQ-type POTRA domain-containing protein [Eubacteriales bacterium]